jgi:hypothetical protein
LIKKPHEILGHRARTAAQQVTKQIGEGWLGRAARLGQIFQKIASLGQRVLLAPLSAPVLLLLRGLLLLLRSLCGFRGRLGRIDARLSGRWASLCRDGLGLVWVGDSSLIGVGHGGLCRLIGIGRSRLGDLAQTR